MPKIIDEKVYDGAMKRIERLGLSSTLEQIRELITGFELLVEERRHGNGAAALRQMLDDRFAQSPGWQIKKVGGIDWQKSIPLNEAGASACVGVELQVSARSDLLTNDLTHLMQAIENGIIDVGIIVVPADVTATYLTDRCPNFRSAIDHVTRAKAQFSPIMLLSIGHDGVGPALPKKRTNLGAEPPYSAA